MSDTTQDPKVLDASLRIILGFFNALGFLAFYSVDLAISYILLLFIATILSAERSILRAPLLNALKAAASRFGQGVGITTALNGFMLLFVIGFNWDEEKNFWEAFQHAFPVGLVVSGFMVVVQSAIMVLYSYCSSGSSTVEGVEMEPLADIEAQQDEASFEYKA